MPGGYGNIKSNEGKPFQPGQSGNPGGRPKKIYNVLKEKGYSKDEIVDAFTELAFYSPHELEELVSQVIEKRGKEKIIIKGDVPVIFVIIANVYLNAFKKGSYFQIKDLVEMILGKPNQRAELKIEEERPKQVFKIGNQIIEL